MIKVNVKVKVKLSTKAKVKFKVILKVKFKVYFKVKFGSCSAPKSELRSKSMIKSKC